MLRTVVALGWLAVIALAPNPASAWAFQGHRVVGAIADRLLTPAAKAQVQQILNDGDTRGIDLR